MTPTNAQIGNFIITAYFLLFVLLFIYLFILMLADELYHFRERKRVREIDKEYQDWKTGITCIDPTCVEQGQHHHFVLPVPVKDNESEVKKEGENR